MVGNESVEFLLKLYSHETIVKEKNYIISSTLAFSQNTLNDSPLVIHSYLAGNATALWEDVEWMSVPSKYSLLKNLTAAKSSDYSSKNF